MLHSILLFGGIGTVVAGAVVPMVFSSAPSSIQTNDTLQPIGLFIINNQNWIVLFGILLVFIAALFV